MAAEMYISKYFTLEEIECKCGCGFAVINQGALFVADEIREWRGKPKTPNSGCRCPDHNADVGGSRKSRHLPRYSKISKRIESDGIDLPDDKPQEVADFLEENFPNVSYGVYKTFIHIDTRPEKRTWSG